MDNTPFQNPFRDDIVFDLSRIEPSITGLNNAPLQALLSEFSLLNHPIPRHDAKLGHALLVTSPQAGYGKSHLMGRFFKELNGQAITVFIRPFEDPASCWKSILDRIVHGLDAPEPCEKEGHTAGDPSLLDALAYAVFAHLIADLVETGQIPSPSPSETARALREAPRQSYKHAPRAQWARQINGLFQHPEHPLQLVRRLKVRGLDLTAAPRAWLRVLQTYAWSDNEALRESCLDWLKGESIDEDSAKAIGIPVWDIPRPHASMGQVNELCKGRVLDLCQLAGFYRPFIFCFDQTENYGKDPLLARALGEVVQVLTDQAYHQLTVLTANLDPWTKRIRLHWEEAHQARLGLPMELDGLNRQQAEELAYRRLLGTGISEHAVQSFLEHQRPLNALFGETPCMGVRTFLQGCQRMWANFSALSRPSAESFEDLLRRYIDRTEDRTQRLVYDRDILYWVVYDLAQGLSGIQVDRVETRSGLFLPRWRTATQHQILFSFEASSQWQRWQVILERTRNFCLSHPKSKVVYLRTPEQRPVPEDWPNAQELENAKHHFLHIIELDSGEAKEIYAAYALYSDAVQKNIPHAPESVAAFLRPRFHTLWERVLQDPMIAGLSYPFRSGSRGGKVSLALV